MNEEQYKMAYECVVNGKVGEAQKIGEMLKAAVVDSKDVGKVLIDAMNVVGHKYREREIALPQLILATHSFKKMLLPYVMDTKGEAGTVVMGVVQNDIHDIGKNLVVGMLQVYGYKVHDLGKDVPLDKFVEAAKQHNANIVGAGTLLTATMPELETILNKLKDSGMKDKVKYMVGGAPITTTFAKRIGADGYAADAVLAVEMVAELMKGNQCYLAARQEKA
jgi:5-methyltetrahydrofolate--homocysteine methyltransferase